MDELGASGKLGEEIESEWAVVDRLLAKGDESSWAMAVVEAHKIFCQVLAEVSFGEDFEELLHNAGGLFRKINRVLAAHKIFEHITQTRVGLSIRRVDAVAATDDLLSGILDMTGRDFVEPEFGGRFVASLNYFWSHHPRSLAGLIGGVLVLVSLVWFLSDTALGQWVVGMAIGFERFVLGFPGLIAGLLVAFILAAFLSHWLVGRRDK